jgi:2'-5' RNA ligase
MKPKLRAFVAIELPEKIQGDIRSLQRAFAAHRLNIRWVKPVNLHLTIKFLGDIEPSDMEPLGRVLSDTAAIHPMFHLLPQGMGIFPNIRRPRIIWTGIAGQTHILRSIWKSVENVLVPLGFAAEKRPYRGHLTIGRVKTRMDQARLVSALRAHQDFVSESFLVKRLVMYRSELHPSGAVYTKLLEMPLGMSTNHHPNLS